MPQTPDINQQSQGKTKLLASLLLIFATGLLINWFTPLTSDDFGRAMTSLSPDSIWNRYAHWSGRLVADISATWVLSIGPHFADIINSLALVMLIWILATLGTRLAGKQTWTPDYRVLILVFVAYWSGNPKLGHTTFWIVGAANYLWTNVLNLGFALAFFIALQTNRYSLSKGVLITLLGILGGCSNENTAPVTWILLAYFTYHNWRLGKPIKWPIVWLIAMGIGAAILILAPGNFSRIHIPSNMEWYGEPLSWRIWYHLVRRFPDSMMKYWEAYLILLFIAYCIKLPKPVSKAIWLMIIMACLSNLAMISAPAFPKRALQGGYMYMLVAVAIIAHQATVTDTIKHKRLLITGIFLCAIQWLISYGLIAKSFYYTSLQDEYRIALIKQGGQDGAHTIEIPEFYFKPLLRSRDKFDVFFSGSAMAKYYGIDAEVIEYPVQDTYSLDSPPAQTQKPIQ